MGPKKRDVENDTGKKPKAKRQKKKKDEFDSDSENDQEQNNGNSVENYEEHDTAYDIVRPIRNYCAC